MKTCIINETITNKDAERLLGHKLTDANKATLSNLRNKDRVDNCEPADITDCEPINVYEL